jgi:hypothetical protein
MHLILCSTLPAEIFGFGLPRDARIRRQEVCRNASSELATHSFTVGDAADPGGPGPGPWSPGASVAPLGQVPKNNIKNGADQAAPDSWPPRRRVLGRPDFQAAAPRALRRLRRPDLPVYSRPGARCAGWGQRVAASAETRLHRSYLLA